MARLAILAAGRIIKTPTRQVDRTSPLRSSRAHERRRVCNGVKIGDMINFDIIPKKKREKDGFRLRAPFSRVASSLRQRSLMQKILFPLAAAVCHGKSSVM